MPLRHPATTVKPMSSFSAQPGLPDPPADLLAQVADALAWPLLLLDADAALLQANRAGHALLRRGRPLQRHDDGPVRPAQAAQQPAFAAALHAVAHDGQPRLLRLADGGDGGATLSRLAAGAVLVALSGSRADAARAFAELHRLTPAETRVLVRLALGDDGPAAAQALGVSATTVRSQLASLRRKTGHASVTAVLQALARAGPMAQGN
jgi:DNA-binding CsgD family transcriptional regulator